MGYLDNSRGPAYPLILKDLDLSPALGSWFFSLSSLAGLIVYISAKKWLPILGVVKGTKLSLIIMGIGTLLMGLIPELPYQYFFLLLFSMIFGLGQGLSTYCMNLLVANATDSKIRSRAFSALHSCYGVASFAAPLIFVKFLAWEKSWSLFYLYMGVLPFIVLLFVLRIGSGVKIDTVKKEKGTLSFIRRSCYGGVFSFYVAGEIVISSRLIFYLVDGKGFSSEAAAEGLSLFFLTLMGGRLLFAFLPMQGRSYAAMVISLLASLCVFSYGYFINPWALGLLGGTMSFYFPMGMDWLTSRFENNREEMIASSMTQVGVILILMHLFFGEIASVAGVEKALLLAPVLILCSLFFLLLVRKESSNDDQLPHPL